MGFPAELCRYFQPFESRLQFRWEVTDVFNTPIFALPDMNLGDGTFGLVTATDGITRRVMEFALKLYW